MDELSPRGVVMINFGGLFPFNLEDLVVSARLHEQGVPSQLLTLDGLPPSLSTHKNLQLK